MNKEETTLKEEYAALLVVSRMVAHRIASLANGISSEEPEPEFDEKTFEFRGEVLRPVSQDFTTYYVSNSYCLREVPFKKHRCVRYEATLLDDIDEEVCGLAGHPITALEYLGKSLDAAGYKP